MNYNSDKIKLIFGLKLKQLRLDKKFSLSELADRSGLSISYLNEIEKGKKYPKSEKIFALAKALDTEYDSLISIKLSKKLEPITELLNSNILSELPLDMFGVDPSDFLELMSSAPDKLSAFVSTIIEISRNYDMRVEQFYFSVLRSYQEINDNYFPEIEAEAERFFKKYNLKPSDKLTSEFFEDVLTNDYGYTIQQFSEEQLKSMNGIRSVFVPKTLTFYINPELSTKQRAFTFGRELGYQFMEIKNRPNVSSVVEVDSFEQVVNNFKASYFSGSILIHRQQLIEKLEFMFTQSTWSDANLLQLMHEFDATPEQFLHRLSNLITSHFGVNQLFFLRFNHTAGQDEFYLDKEMHLAKLHNPHGTALNEYYCRRWVSLTVLRELEEQQASKQWNGEPICRSQISDYYDSGNQYFVISLAQDSPPKPHYNSSVSMGFLLDEKLLSKFKFITADKKIIRRKVGETCERCIATDCQERIKPPLIIQKRLSKEKLLNAISALE